VLATNRCAVADVYCNDLLVCTEDSCDPATGECVFEEVPECCQANEDCFDDDACSNDICDLNTFTCANTPVTCPTDWNTCTADVCDNASGGCINRPIEGCCRRNGDCNDDNPCTNDTCFRNSCNNDEKNCNDYNPCTLDSCNTETGACEHQNNC